MMKMLRLGMAMIVVACAYSSLAWAGDATGVGIFVYHPDTGNFNDVLFGFVNQNDITVDVKFAVMLKSEEESGDFDVFAVNGDGVQTASIPPRGELSLDAGELVGDVLGPCFDAQENPQCGAVRIQASWPDDVMGSDGTVRKITPIKATEGILSGHLNSETGKPDDLTISSITQIH